MILCTTQWIRAYRVSSSSKHRNKFLHDLLSSLICCYIRLHLPRPSTWSFALRYAIVLDGSGMVGHQWYVMGRSVINDCSTLLVSWDGPARKVTIICRLSISHVYLALRPTLRVTDRQVQQRSTAEMLEWIGAVMSTTVGHRMLCFYFDNPLPPTCMAL